MRRRTAELVVVGITMASALVLAVCGLIYVCREFQGWRP